MYLSVLAVIKGEIYEAFQFNLIMQLMEAVNMSEIL